MASRYPRKGGGGKKAIRFATSRTDGFPQYLKRKTFTADIIVSNPVRRVSDTHGKATTWRKLRWSVSGQKKTLELLNELRRFVNRLYEFVPVTSGVESTLHFNPPLEPVDTSVPEQSPQQLGILETLQLSQICVAQEQQSFAGTTFRRRPVHQRSVRLGTRQFRSEEPMNRRRNGVTKGRISKRETSTYLSVRHLGLGRQNAEQTQCSFSRDLIC